MLKKIARPHCPASLRLLTLVALLLTVSAALAPARAQSLFADPKARQAGDVLTIVLAEQTSAQRQSDYQDRSSAGLGAQGEVDAPTLASRFSADAQFERDASSRNETTQSDLLQGTITARVTGTDEAGNLIVEGERRLNVNGVTHLMRVSGIVRPFDIRYNNTVLSHQIANADVEYRQLGFGRKLFRPATLVKAGAVIVLGVAAFLGLG